MPEPAARSADPVRVCRSALVTGASGFIGRHLVERLGADGCSVSCVVRGTSVTQSLREAGADIISCGIEDPEALAENVKARCPDVVFHVAGVVRSLHRSDFERVNVGGVEAIAAACAACEKPPTLVLLSSLAAAGPSLGDQPRVETDAPEPISEYGRSKLRGEEVAARFAPDVPTTVVRPPIVFGPADHGVLQMMRPIARWGVHIMPGVRRSRTMRLSAIHVTDLVEAMLLAADRGERVGAGLGSGVYFVASDERPTYAEFGRMMAHALGRSGVRLLRVPAPALRCAGVLGDAFATIRRRPVWINSDKIREGLAGSWICSAAKARGQLGWKPAVPLGARLEETARWHREAGWL